MFTTLSKIVGVAIVCSTALFAQNSAVKDSATIHPQLLPIVPDFDDNASSYIVTPKVDTVSSIKESVKDSIKEPIIKDSVEIKAPIEEPKAEIINVADSSKVQVTERQATQEEKVDVATKDSTNASSPASKSKFRTNKPLQSYNFYLPIESEKWEIKSQKHEWNSLSFQFHWTRYKMQENGFSTLLDLGAGFVTGKLNDKYFDGKIRFNGIDLNMKSGLGFAPISNDFIVAFYLIGGVNLKMLNGRITVDDKKINPFTVFVDAIIGGDFTLGYQFFESAGILAGIDVTTNAFGIGGYSREISKTSKVTQMKYIFSGINLTPHIGIFFAF
jgi:hypothetical protein